MDIDKWLEEKYPTWKPTQLQKELFREVVEGKRTIAWFRSGRRQFMKAVFDYIVERRGYDSKRGNETEV